MNNPYLVGFTLWERKDKRGGTWKLYCTEEGHSKNDYPSTICEKEKKEYEWRKLKAYQIKN